MTPTRLARSWTPSEEHDPFAFAGIDAAVAAIRRHVDARLPDRRPRRLRRRRRVRDRDHGSRAAFARRRRGWYLPSRIEDGYGISDANGGEAGRPRHPPDDHRRLRDHGGRRGRRRERGRASTSSSPTTTRRARTARSRPARSSIRRSAGTRAPSCAAPAVAYKLAQALGAADAPRRTSSWSRSPRSRIWCRCGGENRRLVARGPGGARQHRATWPAGADGGLAGRSERARRPRTRLPPRAADQRRRADAPGRRGLELLLTEDSERARGDRRSSSTKSTPSGVRSSSGSAGRPRSRSRRSASGSAYVLAGEGWHQGVVGIVASRIVERYHRPAILIALDGDRPGTGSGRSIPGFDLLGALHAAAEHARVAMAATGRRPGLTVRRSGSRRCARRRAPRRSRADCRAARAGRAGRRHRVRDRSSGSRWPRSSSCSSRAGSAIRPRSCSSRAPGSPTCGGWERAGTRASP